MAAVSEEILTANKSAETSVFDNSQIPPGYYLIGERVLPVAKVYANIDGEQIHNPVGSDINGEYIIYQSSRHHSDNPKLGTPENGIAVEETGLFKKMWHKLRGRPTVYGDVDGDGTSDIIVDPKRFNEAPRNLQQLTVNPESAISRRVIATVAATLIGVTFLAAALRDWGSEVDSEIEGSAENSSESAIEDSNTLPLWEVNLTASGSNVGNVICGLTVMNDVDPNMFIESHIDLNFYSASSPVFDETATNFGVEPQALSKAVRLSVIDQITDEQRSFAQQTPNLVFNPDLNYSNTLYSVTCR